MRKSEVDVKRDVITILKENGEITPTRIVRMTGHTSRSVWKHLGRLKAEGRVSVRIDIRDTRLRRYRWIS